MADADAPDTPDAFIVDEMLQRAQTQVNQLFAGLRASVSSATFEPESRRHLCEQTTRMLEDEVLSLESDDDDSAISSNTLWATFSSAVGEFGVLDTWLSTLLRPNATDLDLECACRFLHTHIRADIYKFIRSVMRHPDIFHGATDAGRKQFVYLLTARAGRHWTSFWERASSKTQLTVIHETLPQLEEIYKSSIPEIMRLREFALKSEIGEI